MAGGRRQAPAPTPRPLGEVLDYLGSLGFDHLYLRQPSRRGERNSRSRASEPSAAAQPVQGQQRPARAQRATADDVKPRGAVASQPPRPNAPPVSPQGSSTSAPSASPRKISAGDSRAVVAAPPAAFEPIEIDAAMTPEQRFEGLDQLREQAAGCTACALARGRRQVVFGSGHPNADLMLIGEGPGAEEDRQGLPFVGPAGALLTRILQAIDIRREEVYIANTVKCRPPRNRDPEAEEVAACRSFLEQQIDLVQPKLIVVLGRVAAQTLLQSGDSLGKLRGSWHSVRGVPTRATYHPAALLRYEKYKRPTWEDMKIVRGRLHELQR